MANPSKHDAVTAYRNGEPLLLGTTQPAHIADAATQHSLDSTFSNTEVEAALDALGTKLNAVIAVLEAHGLKADS